MPFEINVSGAVVEGTWPAVMDGIGPAVAEPVAYQAYANWHDLLNQNIRFPTPYYETQIQVDRSAPDWRVHDNGVVYGPWLEGTGSRNYPVTRFHGYHSAGMATAITSGDVARLIEPVIDDYIGRLG